MGEVGGALDALECKMRARLPPLCTFSLVDWSVFSEREGYSKLSKSVEFRPSRSSSLGDSCGGDAGPVSGGGLFAIGRIPRGSVVWADIPNSLGDWGGLVQGTMDEFEQLYANRWEEMCEYIYWERGDQYRGPVCDRVHSDFSSYMNHSCDPNVWYAHHSVWGIEVMEACRDIDAGEELTIDYATMEGGTHWDDPESFTCTCNADRCRGKVTVEDYKLEEVQNKYKSHFHYALVDCISQLHGGKR